LAYLPGLLILHRALQMTNSETFHSVDDSPGFAAPILNFHGVPEPTTWALALLGASLVGALVRRRRNAA